MKKREFTVATLPWLVPLLGSLAVITYFPEAAHVAPQKWFLIK